jgi:hypothetical protein
MYCTLSLLFNKKSRYFQQVTFKDLGLVRGQAHENFRQIQLIMYKRLHFVSLSGYAYLSLYFLPIVLTIISLSSYFVLEVLRRERYFGDIHNIILSSRGHLEKLTVSQLLKNFISFYGIRILIFVSRKTQNIHILSQMYPV